MRWLFPFSEFRSFLLGVSYGRGESARWLWWCVKMTLGFEGGLELGTLVVRKA